MSTIAFNTRVVNIWGNAAPDIGNVSGSDTTLRVWTTGTGNALQVDSNGGASGLVATFNSVPSAASIAPLSVVASTASGAFLNFSGVFISTASINPTNAAFVIPVYHNSIAAWGYIIASKGII